MNLIKYKLRVWYYHFEVLFTKMQKLFNIRKDIKLIPPGPYCYVIDEERNYLEPINGYWIKPCKYYRSMRRQLDAGCIYVGTIGFDSLLGDQCKICGENNDI